MAQKHTAVELHDNSGNRLQAFSQENDFPLPPVEELSRLHQFRPDLVDRVIELTAEEAKARRERLVTIYKYVYTQNMTSSIDAIVVALVAFAGTGILAWLGHDWVAVAFVGGTLGVVCYAIARSPHQ